MDSLPLRCTCGSLRGTLDPTPAYPVRGVCYCDDCQAYARHLGTPILDEYGGTSVVPCWPSQVRLTQGPEHLRLLRLSPKGLMRWYAGCCGAPIANCLPNPRIPFNGVIRRAIAVDDATLERIYGPARGIQGRFAPGGCPPGASASAPLSVILGTLQLLGAGWLRGANQPSPWFDAGVPRVEARVLAKEERAALYR